MIEDYTVKLDDGQQFAKDDYDNIQNKIIQEINLKGFENMIIQY
jgi:hypothetical protein